MWQESSIEVVYLDDRATGKLRGQCQVARLTLPPDDPTWVVRSPRPSAKASLQRTRILAEGDEPHGRAFEENLIWPRQTMRSISSFPMVMGGHGAVAQWLLYCADPLGPSSMPPRVRLSGPQVHKLMRQADAHRVLPAILRYFPLEDPRFEQARVEADSRRIEALALSTMLRYQAENILAAANALPVALVKGPVFADHLYPVGLRPFGDIDLLAAPEALPQLAPILSDHGFRRVEQGFDPSLLEEKWAHCGNPVLGIEVHTNLVHLARMRAAFSLAYSDIEGNEQTPGALLAIAIMHGSMHYFAWLRHVVDICQAARALTTGAEESRFEMLVARTGTRFAAIIGLTLAYRLFGEIRCVEVAKALGPIRNFRFGRVLIEGGAISAVVSNSIVYNSWRRFIFRELLLHGTLFPKGIHSA